MDKIKIELTLNGENVQFEAEQDTPLLYILRNYFELNGPKFGCGLGQCMACMVLVDGEALPSCQLLAGSISGKNITTLEGLLSEEGELHKVQKAFIKEQAAQCGYCMNGMIINAVALLEKEPSPSSEEIKNQLSLNVCRCGTHSRIVKAVQTAVGL